MTIGQCDLRVLALVSARGSARSRARAVAVELAVVMVVLGCSVVWMRR